MMGPKKARKIVRKIEVTTDTPTEFELGAAENRTERSESEIDKEGGGEANSGVRKNI